MTIKLLCFDTFMMQNLPRRHDNQQYPPMSSRCLFWPRINTEVFLFWLQFDILILLVSMSLWSILNPNSFVNCNKIRLIIPIDIY